MIQDRRGFLSTLGAATAGLAAGRSLVDTLGIARSTPAAKLKRVGIQLYTLRREAATDLAGTLVGLAKIGYKEIELAGLYNHPASEVHDLLAANGLAAPSAHIAIEQIETQAARTFDDAKTLGLDWITVPSLPAGKRATADDWKMLASRFNRVASDVKKAGFRFAFHNHNDIVKPTGDVLPIDLLMSETDPSLVSFELDIFWAVNGGADPVTLLARYPNRFRMLHVKDGKAPYATQTDVGDGSIDFRTIFARAKGIEHYFVESDTAQDPMTFAAASHKYLSNLDF